MDSKPKISFYAGYDPLRRSKMFEIIGIQRTSKNFLERVQETSKDSEIKTIVDRLKKLRIFSTITEMNNGLSVTEERRSISFSGDTTKDVPRGYFKLKLPNLFGRAENLEVSLSTSKDMSFKFTKPIICGSLSFLNICGSKDVKKAPSEEYHHARISMEIERESCKVSVGQEKIGYLLQTFLEIQKSFSPFDVKIKTGIADSRSSKAFLKTQLSTFLSKKFARNLFTSLSFSIGAIFGTPHITEKYYLGENIRGYKDMSISPKSSGIKVGGKSFFEVTHKVGLCSGDVNTFIFGSLGYVSKENNLANTFRSAVKACSYRNSECLGASIGLGMNVPIMRSKDGPIVGASFAVPLTDNKQIQRLQFGFNMDF